MKKIVQLFVLFIFVILISSQQNFAQGKYGLIGKIFTKVEADQLFDKASQSFGFTRNELQLALKKAKNYIFFYLVNGKVYIATDSKDLQKNSFSNFNPDVNKAYGYSTKVVKEFLNSSNAKTFYFEIRGGNNFKGNLKSVSGVASGGEVTTVSDGEDVLEMSIACPPICM
jgi:hypothetical protein